MSSLLNTPKSRLTLALGALIGGYSLIGLAVSAKPAAPRRPSKAKSSASVNGQFFRRLVGLAPILFPSRFGRETGLLAVHTVCLVARTWASVYFAYLEGKIVSALVAKQGRKFTKLICVLLGLGIPVGILNAALSYFQDALALAFRTRLTEHLRSRYMSNLSYYKLLALDKRLTNIDQLLVSDVERFSSKLAELWSSLAKPTLDLLVYNVQLMRNVGVVGFCLGTAMVHLGTGTLRVVSPGFGRLVAEEQQLEGDYRAAQSRIITHAEEIAFYRGGEVEESFLTTAFDRLRRHMLKSARVAFRWHAFEHFVTKYFWAVCGYAFVAIPILEPFGRVVLQNAQVAQQSAAAAVGDSGAVMAARTGAFIENKKLLMSISDAFTRFLQSMKDISHLAGHTSRIGDMMDVLRDVEKGVYYRPNAEGEMARVTDPQGHMRLLELSEQADTVLRIERMRLETPAGDVLLNSLDLNVPPGTAVLVTGPNGCGKSSLFRTMGGLWPIAAGEMWVPPPAERVSDRPALFFIAQKPFMTRGTLRDNLIYPYTREAAAARGITEVELLRVLEVVQLTYIVDREGGFDSVRRWEVVCSGGEQQRLQLARLFLHNPHVCVLDESTSAVALPVEESMYSYARRQGISIFTVSHRLSLRRHHDFVLKFDGLGGYTFDPIDKNEVIPEGA